MNYKYGTADQFKRVQLQMAVFGDSVEHYLLQW